MPEYAEPAVNVYQETDVNAAVFLAVNGHKLLGGGPPGEATVVFRFDDPEGKAKTLAEEFKAGKAEMPRFESFEDWFVGQGALCANEVAGEYAKADGKKLIKDNLWARRELDRLTAEIREVGEYAKIPDFMEDPETRDRIISFFEEAYRLAVYFPAAIQVTSFEIVQRAKKNAVNLHFGLLKLALSGGDDEAQWRALKKLEELAYGIAENSGLFRKDEEGWGDATNQAVFEQLKHFSELDGWTSLEFMIDNKFAVVGNAIKERIIDEIRAREKHANLDSLDDEQLHKALESIPSKELSAEDCAVIESLFSELESLDDGSTKGIQRTFAGIAQTLRESGLGGLTTSQLIEEIKKQIAASGGVSDRQARNNWQAFLESPEALAKTVQALREIARIKKASN